MSGEGVNPPVRPPSLEERLAEDRTSGVVTFRKAVSVRGRGDEGGEGLCEFWEGCKNC